MQTLIRPIRLLLTTPGTTKKSYSVKIIGMISQIRFKAIARPGHLQYSNPSSVCPDTKSEKNVLTKWRCIAFSAKPQRVSNGTGRPFPPDRLSFRYTLCLRPSGMIVLSS